jgi:hypothetical protein
LPIEATIPKIHPTNSRINNSLLNELL